MDHSSSSSNVMDAAESNAIDLAHHNVHEAAPHMDSTPHQDMSFQQDHQDSSPNPVSNTILSRSHLPRNSLYRHSEEQLFQFYMKMSQYLRIDASMSDERVDRLNVLASRQNTGSDHILNGNDAGGATRGDSFDAQIGLVNESMMALQYTQKRIALYRAFCCLLHEEKKRRNTPEFDQIFSKGVLLAQNYLTDPSVDDIGTDSEGLDTFNSSAPEHAIPEQQASSNDTGVGHRSLPNHNHGPPDHNRSDSSVSDSHRGNDVFLVDNAHESYVEKRKLTQQSMPRKVLRFVVKHLLGFFPGIRELIRYFDGGCPKRFLSDLIGGLSVGAISIPQCMSYGLLAGLPPVYGIYTSLIPMLVYCLFGTSKHASIAPVSMIALMNASAIENLPTLEEKVQRTVLICFQAGIFLLLLGFLRLGFLVNFLSQPVLSGFTSAVGLVIVVSQMKYLLGIKAASAKGLHFSLYNIAIKLGDTKWQSLLFGVICLIILIACKKFYLPYKWRGKKKRITLTLIPVNLLLVVLCTLIMFIVYKIASPSINEADPLVEGIHVLGSMPTGFPSPTLSMFSVSWSDFASLLLVSIPIGFIGYIQTISVVKLFAERFNYDIDANQELVAIGFASIFGSVFQSFSPTGSMSRTSVGASSGTQSQMHSLVVFVTLTLVVLFLMPLFYFLPKPLLAAIIIAAVYKIINISAFIQCLRTKPVDALSLAVAFLATLFIGLDVGVLIAAAVSLLLVIFRSSRARLVTLGRIPGTQEFTNVKDCDSCITYNGVLVLRFDADLLFINANHWKDAVLKRVEADPFQVQVVVLDFSSVSSIDSTGINGLLHLYSLLEKKHHVRMLISSMKRPVWRICERAKLYKKIAEEQFFSRTALAVYAAQSFITSRGVANASERLESDKVARGSSDNQHESDDSGKDNKGFELKDQDENVTEHVVIHVEDEAMENRSIHYE